MIGTLKTYYEQVKSAYLGPHAAVVPEAFRSHFVCFGGASEVQFILGKLVPPTAERILIVGVFGGRDYFYFKTRGTCEVHAVDLAMLSEYENFQIANVEEGLPYPDQFFDVIVMNEVLEHLPRDYLALGHLRRVLEDSGVLVLTVPFLHEAEPTHVRVHTRISVERLLACCGYTVTAVIERPGMGFWPRWINPLNHIVNICLFRLSGRIIYHKTLPFLWRLEYRLGQYRLPWRRFSRRWGACFACRKAPGQTDYVAMNRLTFCVPAETKSGGRGVSSC